MAMRHLWRMDTLLRWPMGTVTSITGMTRATATPATVMAGDTPTMAMAMAMGVGADRAIVVGRDGEATRVVTLPITRATEAFGPIASLTTGALDVLAELGVLGLEVGGVLDGAKPSL